MGCTKRAAGVVLVGEAMSLHGASMGSCLQGGCGAGEELILEALKLAAREGVSVLAVT
jgi:hypothetical protein